MLPNFTITLLFVCAIGILTHAAVFAQNEPLNNRHQLPDELSQTVRQKIDSLTNTAYANLDYLNRQMQAVEVEVNNNGILEINGNSVDLVNPMTDILNGVEKLTRAAGLPDADMQTLKEQVNELPTYLKTGWDRLKEWTNMPSTPQNEPAATPAPK
ncbi:MAG TPA: hypothetical protein PK239_17405 [Chitinophagales bacterium]|nr:hypothetical protein [Chitinophagales bacterium]HRK29054.1 hypothetical protein [Chitinophagales bacterium]